MKSDLAAVKLMDLAASKAYFGTPAKPGPIYDIARKSANFWLSIKKISKLPNINARSSTRSYLAEDMCRERSMRGHGQDALRDAIVGAYSASDRSESGYGTQFDGTANMERGLTTEQIAAQAHPPGEPAARRHAAQARPLADLLDAQGAHPAPASLILAVIGFAHPAGPVVAPDLRQHHRPPEFLPSPTTVLAALWTC